LVCKVGVRHRCVDVGVSPFGWGETNDLYKASDERLSILRTLRGCRVRTSKLYRGRGMYGAFERGSRHRNRFDFAGYARVDVYVWDGEDVVAGAGGRFIYLATLQISLLMYQALIAEQ
jgi:hypothetical protein